MDAGRGARRGSSIRSGPPPSPSRCGTPAGAGASGSRRPARSRHADAGAQPPVSGAPVRFFVAGEFGRPSVSLGDAVIQARGAGRLGRARAGDASRSASARTPDAVAAERDRFVAAFGTLNGGGAGRFRDFRDMHVSPPTPRAHGNVGFLPWHRAYLLDLERELQAIDPSVTLPYWRFDQAGSERLHPRVHGCVRTPSAVLEFTRRASVQHLAHRRGARDLADAAVRTPDRRLPASRPSADDRPRRRRAERRRTRTSTPWKATRTARAHTVQRLHQRDPDGRAGSAVLHAPRQRRPPVGQVAVGAQAHEPGRAARLRSGAHRPRRASTSRTRCGRGTASPRAPRPSDRAGRHVRSVADRPRRPGSARSSAR